MGLLRATCRGRDRGVSPRLCIWYGRWGAGGSSEPHSSVLDIISNFKMSQIRTPQEARTRCQECGLLPRGLGEPASFIQAPFSARSSLGLKQRNFHLSPLGDCTEGKWTPFGQGGTVPHPENLVSACVITQKCLLKPSCDPLKIKFPVSHPGSP